MLLSSVHCTVGSVARWLLTGLSIVAFTSHAFAAAADTAKSKADDLVQLAVDAEAKGDSPRSFALLHDALKADPENKLARWQLGEVKVNNQWVSVEELQRWASIDPRQAEYRQRRSQTGKTAQEQLALARWCRQSNLSQEAVFHWASVLAIEPKNEEALRALNLVWQKDRLVRRDQVGQAKDQMRESKRTFERWSSKTVKWRRNVAGVDISARIAALAEIRAINDAEAIAALEDVTLGRDANRERHGQECAAIGTAFLDALAKIQGQAATESLARHAVLAADEKVRRSATEKLKPREQHDYVPMLVDALGMPIETSYSLTTGPDGSVHYLRSLYREGRDSDWSWESRRAAVQRDMGGRRQRYDTYTGQTTDFGPGEPPIVTAAKKANVAAAYQKRYSMNVAATESQVSEANRSVETLNARIVPVLTATTGQELGDNPKSWWDWWKSTNEYASYDHPVDQHYDFGEDQFYYNFPTYSTVDSRPRPRGPMSCFVKGTPVWTKTGLRPIETIEVGDLVLAQNVETGELKYEPVLGRTVRPPSPIVKLSFDGEEVRTTRGHLFWVSGSGWRMAKELEKGAMLHGLNGGLRIRSTESGDDAEAFNLVVADVSTYFVGEHGFLVHDNKPRTPTRALVPGVLAKSN